MKNLNNNYDKSISINTTTQIWEINDILNYKEKILSVDEDKKTSILELNQNSKLTLVPSVKKVNCKSNCKIFRKENYRAHYEKIIIDTTKQEWLKGQGNLQVMPLVESTALVL